MAVAMSVVSVAVAAGQMNAWEESYAARIGALRAEEIDVILKQQFIDAASLTVHHMSD